MQAKARQRRASPATVSSPACLDCKTLELVAGDLACIKVQGSVQRRLELMPWCRHQACPTLLGDAAGEHLATSIATAASLTAAFSCWEARACAATAWAAPSAWPAGSLHGAARGLIPVLVRCDVCSTGVGEARFTQKFTSEQVQHQRTACCATEVHRTSRSQPVPSGAPYASCCRRCRC